jgi:hypothetical protein
MDSLLRLSLRVLYLFAPLIVASMFAGIVLRFDLLGSLRRPLDAGRTFRGRRFFGDHKTWRGVVVSVVGCVVCTAVQKYVLGDRARALALVDYRSVNVIVFGASMGGGAMLGELPNSFAKRQLGIDPGKAGRGPLGVLFYVWDQVDLLLCWLLLFCWVRVTFPLIAVSVVIALALHPLVALIGFLVGARASAR